MYLKNNSKLGNTTEAEFWHDMETSNATERIDAPNRVIAKNRFLVR